MIKLSKIISKIKPSQTQAAAARASELKAKGCDIVSFTLGEPDFDTPAHIKKAAVDALANGHTRYTKVPGIDPLRAAICAKLKREQKTDFSPAEVIVTNGGKHAIAAACAVLLDPGDEVIIPSPYWTSYPDIAQLSDAVPVIVNTTPSSGYTLSGQQLRSAWTDKTKMIILNSPSNPTGGCYSRQDLEDLRDTFLSLPGHEKVVILLDEVYEYFTYDGFDHVSMLEVAPQLKDNLLYINAFSKSYAMTGWRVGYAAGPLPIIKAMANHQSQFVSNVCSIAQYAALAADDDGGRFPREMVGEFAKRRKLVCETIEKTPGITLSVPPQGAFYAFIRIEEILGKHSGTIKIGSAADFSNYLLEQHGVAVVSGEAFGDPGAVRLSFAQSTEQIQEGLKRIVQAVADLK